MRLSSVLRLGLALAALALVASACARPTQKAPAQVPNPGPGAPAGPTPAEQLPPRPFAGSPAPEWSGVDVRTGKAVKSADLKGSVVLLNFWATWCAPCKVEMPEIQAAYEQSKGELTVVAIGADDAESPEKLKAFADRLGLTFSVVHDGAKAAQAYQVYGLPTTFFLDRRGIIRTRFTGVLNPTLISQLTADAAKH